MPRLTLPSESCCFRLDSDYGYRQQFPMTFHDVGLSDDGFEFNGENSYIRVPNSSELNLNEHTISFLIKMNNISDFQVIAAKGGAFGDDCNYSVGIYDDRIYYDVFINNDRQTKTLLISSLDLENFHEITVCYDKTYRYFYVNGELVINKSELQGHLDHIPKDLTVGSNDGDVQFFNGTIKHVSIYNRALTAQEVADRYNQSTFLFLNDTPTPTQQAYLDWQNSRVIGRSR